MSLLLLFAGGIVGQVVQRLDLCEAYSESLMPELVSLSGMTAKTSESLMPERDSTAHCEDA